VSYHVGQTVIIAQGDDELTGRIIVAFMPWQFTNGIVMHVVQVETASDPAFFVLDDYALDYAAQRKRMRTRLEQSR
jgi:hypothetical protein